MEVLPILVLLCSVVQLCSATPDVAPLTCGEDNAAAASNLAVHHINMHHEHGYKFRLSEIQGNKTEKVDEGCNIKLQLDLLETKCHTVNPKPFEDCELRDTHSRPVIANCNVTISVKNSDAEVTEYNCDTRQVHTNREMAMMCPDCPVLIELNSPHGLKAADSIVKTFNQNTSNQHYYILQEVGRILTGYIPGSGMMYYPEVVLVETRCPLGSRIAIEACKPLCPDRAHHALCSASSNSEGVLGRMDCEFYPPKNTTALGPDEKEPVCERHHHGGHFDPPSPPGHADRKGPPPHAHGQGHSDDNDHGNSQGHGHGHGKGHSHAQGKGHSHAHGQGHSDDNAHGNSQGHGHDQAGGQGPPHHAHGQGHSDDNDDAKSKEHGRGHGRGHSHAHGQGHSDDNDHGNSQGHGHDQAGGQGPPHHAHGQGHSDDNDDAKSKEHGRGHGRGHSHAHGQGHSDDNDHGNSQGHGHDQAGGQGPPPHAPGRHPFHPCHGVLTNVDPALHPICSWPHPEPPPNPRES